MGYDAACMLRFNGTVSRGTARLEHKDLFFRGPFRLAIPLKDISEATAAEGVLSVRFGDQTADFEIGASASKWAERILNPPSRLDKLGVKPGMRVWLIECPDDGFEAEVASRGASVTRRKPTSGAPVDLVFFGAARRESLVRLGELVESMTANGAIWVVRPKGQVRITEADTMAAGKRAGLVDVKVVSFSDTLTAEKFVIPVAKRASRGHRAPAPRRSQSSASRVRT